MNSGLGKEDILLALGHLITRMYIVRLFVLFNTGKSLGLFLDSFYSLSSKVGMPESLSDRLAKARQWTNGGRHRLPKQQKCPRSLEADIGVLERHFHLSLPMGRSALGLWSAHSRARNAVSVTVWICSIPRVHVWEK